VATGSVLLTPRYNSLTLFCNDKAFRVGDVVTVLVTQTTVASAGSQTATSKQAKVRTEAEVGAFQFHPASRHPTSSRHRKRKKLERHHDHNMSGYENQPNGSALH